MRTSETLTKIAPALTAAISEVQAATKNAKNPHYRNTYADITSVLDAVRPVLAAHGLCAVQSPGWHDGRLTLTTRLLHTSGEWIETTAETPIPKPDPQGVGSAITYLRRYSLTAMLGVGQDDDDGEAARPTKPGPKATEARQVVARATRVLETADASEDVQTLGKYVAALEAAIASGDEGRCAKGIAATTQLLDAITALDLVDA